MRKPSKKPEWQKTVAKERMGILFSLAERGFPSHPARAHRYVDLATRIGKRYNIKLKKEWRRKFCKHCLHYLVLGSNARVRTRPSQQAVVVECVDCGKVMRFPYRREKKR